MENTPLRGLLGVSSPCPEPQLATPQPTAPMVEEPLKINHTTKAFYLDHVVELSRQMSLVSGLSREANTSMW